MMCDGDLSQRLRRVASGSQVHVTWRTLDGRQEATGTLTTDNPELAARRLETDERTLLLTPTDNEINVSEITTSETNPLGCLVAIYCYRHEIKPLRLTDAGVDVPPSLVGYTGFLWIDHGEGCVSSVVPEPGLQQYDTRYLAQFVPSTRCHSRVIKILSPEPIRRYKTVDERTSVTALEPTDKQQRYDDIEAVMTTVRALSEAVSGDSSFEGHVSNRIEQRLFDIQSQLLDARNALIEPIPTEQQWMTDDSATYSWTSYTDAFEWLLTQTKNLKERAKADEALTQQQQRTAVSAIPPETHFEVLQQLLDGEHDAPRLADHTGGVSND